MSREAGLHRGGRGLEVPDLAHQHDVRILSQHRTERLGEGEPLGLVDLDLGDPRDVVLDRVLDGDDVDLPRLELVDGGVERGGLAAAGGAGDQHHALAVAQQSPEHLELARGKAEVAERPAEVGLVQDPDDDLLAPPGDGYGRDPEIHHLPVHPRRRAAVVWAERIGDVELGPHFDAADQRRAGGGGKSHHLTQYAVDPVADHHAALGGLRVNVAGPFADAVADHRVHQLGHRRVERALAGGLDVGGVNRLDPSRLETPENPLDGTLGTVELVELLGDRIW